MKTKNGFNTRENEKTFTAKTLHYSKVEDLKNNPYWIAKEKALAVLKPTRGMAIHDPNKTDFFGKVKGKTLFSKPESMPG